MQIPEQGNMDMILAGPSTPMPPMMRGSPRALRRWLAILLFLSLAVPITSAQPTLPGTKPFTFDGDPAAAMVDSIHAFLLRETAAVAPRQAYFEKSDVASRRDRFRRIIGAVDARIPVTAIELTATSAVPAEVARGKGYRVFAVRWPVFDDVEAEGLLLEPEGPPKARIVAIPDAEGSPEMLVGMAPGVEPSAQFARRLAENGCQVVVPMLIDRSDTWSAFPARG